jgi:sphinganine-1-phosphate aldolase
MAAKRGISAPEMVVGPSAHAAYWKAAEYFNIKLVIASLGADYRYLCVACVRGVLRRRC